MTSNKRFLKTRFNEYIDVDDKYGMSYVDYALFGDRKPEGYEKIRLISKTQHTVIWLFKKEEIIDDQIEVNYHLIQQIPRELPQFDEKIACINHLKSDLYLKMRRCQGMRNLVFDI